jgi:hypothetical protein
LAPGLRQIKDPIGRRRHIIDRRLGAGPAMMNGGLSRWTMAYFAAALGAFLVAQVLMVAGFTYPAEALMSPRTLVGVHLLTIGWLTLLMIGALLQFIPVITGTSAIDERAGLASLIAIGLGLVGMIAGFLALDGLLPSVCAAALPVGGGLVLLGLLLVGATIGRALASARPLPLPGRFVALGLGFLLLTAGLGLSFALALAWPEVFPWGGWLSHGLELHVMSGLIGWFTLTAMGVSYRLLSMFMLAPEEEGGIGAWVLRLAAAGLAVVWLDAFLEGPTAHLLAAGGVLLLLAAAVLYLADMVRLYRTRRRPVLELNSKAAAAALIALGLSVVGFALLAVTGASSERIGSLGYLLLFGWLSGLGLGQLYKIVPFLTWLERYGPRLGKAAVPHVQDLVSERRAAPWFALYFLAVAVGALAGAFGFIDLWRAAILAHFLASLFIARELWRARYVEPAVSPGAASPSAFANAGTLLPKSGASS